MFIVGLYAIIGDSILAVFLGLLIYAECRKQWMILETGGEDWLFGYDFSQGYTSLERDERRRRRRAGAGLVATLARTSCRPEGSAG